MRNELILEVGGEGGAVRVYGRREDSGWIFWRETTEMDLIGPDDEEVWERRTSKEVGSLEIALHPNWFKLYPLHVHSDFVVWLRAEYARLRAELSEGQRRRHDKYQHQRWEEFFKKAETDHSQL